MTIKEVLDKLPESSVAKLPDTYELGDQCCYLIAYDPNLVYDRDMKMAHQALAGLGIKAVMVPVNTALDDKAE